MTEKKCPRCEKIVTGTHTCMVKVKEKLPGVGMWIHSAEQDGGGVWMNVHRITFTPEELRLLLTRAIEMARDGGIQYGAYGNDRIAYDYTTEQILKELMGG